jgi:hypothetical protein
LVVNSAWDLPIVDPSHQSARTLGEWYQASAKEPSKVSASRRKEGLAASETSYDDEIEQKESSRPNFPLLIVPSDMLSIIDMTYGSQDEKSLARKVITAKTKMGYKRKGSSKEGENETMLKSRTRLWLQVGDQAVYADETGESILCMLPNCISSIHGEPGNEGKSGSVVKRSPSSLSRNISTFYDVVSSPKKQRQEQRLPEVIGANSPRKRTYFTPSNGLVYTSRPS